MRCILSEKDDLQISKYFINAFLNPELIESYRKELLTSFDVDGTFQVLLISIENSDNLDSITLRRLSFQLQILFEKIESKYTFFWFDSFFVLIVNNIKENHFIDIINKMLKRTKKKMKDYIIDNRKIEIQKFWTADIMAKEAIDFASKLLIPKATFLEYIKNGSTTFEEAKRFGVTPKFMTYRCFNLGLVKEFQF